MGDPEDRKRLRVKAKNHAMKLFKWDRPVQSRKEEWLRRLFKIGVLLKGVDGLLETAGGILFLSMSRWELTQIVLRLTRPEILEDPDDFIANALRHAFSHLSSSGKLFGSFYLLLHGVIKLFLVICLLRGKLWSFPTAIAVLLGFIGFQLYRIGTHFSWVMVFLTVLDAVIVLLIRHEYVYLKHHLKGPS